MDSFSFQEQPIVSLGNVQSESSLRFLPVINAVILEVVQIFKDRAIYEGTIFFQAPKHLRRNPTGTYETMYSGELITGMSEVKTESAQATFLMICSQFQNS